ncbi:thermonuclease family protein [Thermodesulfobacteriota bacterium]
MQISRLSKIITAVLFFVVFANVNLSAQTWQQVRWVDDGDTIVLKDGRRIRYIGINTPEIEHRDRKAEPYGDQAKQFNVKLVLHKAVRLEFDREQRDHYGRVLAYVFLVDGSLVNQKIVEHGYAHVLYRLPNTVHYDRLLQAQRRAMTAGVGIWSDWQETGGKKYLANKKSKRFHRGTCPYGKKTSAANRIIFKTSWEAFEQGYAPGRKCFSKHPGP